MEDKELLAGLFSGLKKRGFPVDSKGKFEVSETADTLIKNFLALSKEDIQNKIDTYKKSPFMRYSLHGTVRRNALCPCPIESLVVSGSKQARLIKKDPVIGDYWTYWFNSDGTPCMVNDSMGYTEFISKNGNTEIGIFFDEHLSTIEVREALYENGCIKLLKVTTHNPAFDFMSTNIYNYEYENGLLMKCTESRGNTLVGNGTPMEYTFYYEKPYIISSYTINGGSHIYKTTVKRDSRNYCKPFLLSK